VPETTKKALRIVTVDTVTDVAREALGIKLYTANKGFFEEIREQKRDIPDKVEIPAMSGGKLPKPDFLA